MSSCEHTLRLYIAGISPDNQESIIQLKEAIKESLGDNYELEVIDILCNPELAENDKIIATPTLVRELPAPAQKVIIDFSCKERLLLGMDLVIKG